MKINLQIATKEKNIPKLSLFNLWANTVSKDKKQITIKIVDEVTILTDIYFFCFKRHRFRFVWYRGSGSNRHGVTTTKF